MDELRRRASDMWSNDAVGCRPERMSLGQGLRVGYIKRGTQSVLLQRLQQSAGLHDWSASCVYKQCSVLHQAEFHSANQPVGLRCEGNDEDHDIGLGQ